MINLPTRLRMDTASWKPQQTPRLYVSQTCPQYGCIPPRITRLFIILSHKTKGFHTLFFFSQFVFFKANTHSPYSPTHWQFLPWPLRLYLYSYRPCGLSHLETKHQLLFSIYVKCVTENTPVQYLPFLAIAMAVALPIPLLAPVIIKDLPTTDTSRSWGSKSLHAVSYPFLGVTLKKTHLRH